MNKSSPNIFKSSKLFFYILKSLGLAHYQFDHKLSRFKENRWNYFGIIATVCLWISMTWLSMENFEQFNEFNGVPSKLLNRLWQHQYFLQNFFGIFLTALGFTKRRHVEQFLLHIAHYDQIIDQLKYRNSSTSSNWRFLTVVLYLITGTTILLNQIFAVVVYDVYYTSDSCFFIIIKIIAYTYFTEFYLMTSMKFILSTFCIYNRIKALIMNIR